MEKIHTVCVMRTRWSLNGKDTYSVCNKDKMVSEYKVWKEYIQRV